MVERIMMTMMLILMAKKERKLACRLEFILLRMSSLMLFILFGNILRLLAKTKKS